jgi:hypothetical protein
MGHNRTHKGRCRRCFEIAASVLNAAADRNPPAACLAGSANPFIDFAVIHNTGVRADLRDNGIRCERLHHLARRADQTRGDHDAQVHEFDCDASDFASGRDPGS